MVYEDRQKNCLVETHNFPLYLAEVVELVDTQRSERCGSNPLEVRVLSSAHLIKNSVIRHW